MGQLVLIGDHAVGRLGAFVAALPDGDLVAAMRVYRVEQGDTAILADDFEPDIAVHIFGHTAFHNC